MRKPSADTTSTKRSIGQEFALEAFVDFPDDACYASEPITPAHIDAMMRRLAECGVRRVSWEVYGDGRSGFLTCDNTPTGRNYALTYHGMGHNTSTRRPLKLSSRVSGKTDGLQDSSSMRQPVICGSRPVGDAMCPSRWCGP